MLPPAPGLLSTRNCWPKTSVIFKATKRAMVSAPPPGVNGMRMRTGLFGRAPWVQAAPAQSYPDRPIRVSSPNPAGGSNDTIVRIVAAKMSAILDTPIVVDNRGGAGGKIGAEAAAHAPPDGYTLLAGS